jgi:hypothetical protein
LRDDWRAYWERRPALVRDSATLGHGKVVKLLGKAAWWHSRRFVLSLAPEKSWILLDTGCGAGDEIVRYAEEVGRIVGIDFSLGMLKVCRERLDFCGVTNADLVMADLRHLPFRDGSFEGSISMGVLLFMNEKEAEGALAELSRVTKKAIMVHGKNSISPYGAELRLAERFIKRIRERQPYDYHRPFWWYRGKLSRYGRISRSFSIGLWIPQVPDRLKSLLGSVEVLTASLGFGHPFGKEYYVTVRKRRPRGGKDFE